MNVKSKQTIYSPETLLQILEKQKILQMQSNDMYFCMATKCDQRFYTEHEV